MSVIPFPGAARRVLRHNLDAEASVLGGIILRNEALDLVTSLEVEAFYDHRHKVVFTAIRNLASRMAPIDVVTLETEIERAGKLDAIGGIAFLGDLALRVPTADNVATYAKLIQDYYTVRKIAIAASELVERSYNPAYEADELLGEFGAALALLHRFDAGTASQKARWTTPLGEFLGDDEPDDDDAEDWMIRDLIPRGEPFLWGGPMKGGKTWGALDLCIAVALGRPWLGKFDNTWKGPGRVLGVFLEDSKRRLRKRLWELTRAHGTTPNNPTLREHLSLSRAPLRLPDATDQRRITSEIKAFGAKVVIVDNLTRVMVGDPNNTRDAAAFTRAWTEIGEETGASIGFLHHTRKPSGDGKTIDPFDLLRGSGDFGATARNIIVTTPIRTETDEKLSEVRMRGNLDLRRESFALAFERKEQLGKWKASLLDRGDIGEVKEAASKDRKIAKETKKKDDLLAEQTRRRDRAVMIARVEGSVTQRRLADDFGMSSERSLASIFAGLVGSGVFVSAGRRGYELADANRQGDLVP